MDYYKFSENTLIHSVGFNLFKFSSILEHGILSEKSALRENVNLARNFDGYNFDEYISMIRYIYVDNGVNSSYNRFAKKGISFIVEDVDFIYDYNEEYINYNDEVLVKDKIDRSKIKCIMVPEEYAYSSLKDLPMINLRSYKYKNIKNNADNLIEFAKHMGYEITSLEKNIYENILFSLSVSLKDFLGDRENKEKDEVCLEDKLYLAEFVSGVVSKSFSVALGKDDVTLLEAINYLNGKSLNLPIYINRYMSSKKRS